MSYVAVKKKSLLQRYWHLPLIVGVLFLVFSIPVYAYLTGFAINDVGQGIFGVFGVGNGKAWFAVGGVPHPDSNLVAQSIFPIICVVIILLFALKSLAQTEGLNGFMKTMLLIVVGAIMLGAVVVILNQLT